MNILRCRAEFSSVAAVYDRRGLQSLRRSESAATVCRSPKFFRRGGRAVDRAGLENRKAERPREFESHPLRRLSSTSGTVAFGRRVDQISKRAISRAAKVPRTAAQTTSDK